MAAKSAAPTAIAPEATSEPLRAASRRTVVVAEPEAARLPVAAPASRTAVVSVPVLVPDPAAAADLVGVRQDIQRAAAPLDAERRERLVADVRKVLDAYR